MAYKISGNATHASRAHVIKNGIYIGYKDVSAGAYNLVFDADNNAGVMAVSEKSDGETAGYGGMTAIPTGDSVNITLPEGLSVTNITLGTITTVYNNGAYYQDASISSVDTSKTILLYNGGYPLQNAWGQNAWSMLQLLNSTTIRLHKGTNAEQKVSYTLLTMDGISVQHGLTTLTPPGTDQFPYSEDVTISEVNFSNSTPVHTGHRWANYGSDPRYIFHELELINSTTLRIKVGSMGTWMTDRKIAWQVVDFG